jgi:DNA-binding response OmpR family regulator
MMDLGAKGYVAKPFTPEMLRAGIERLLGAGQ